MLFILINETRSGLTQEDFKALGGMMSNFYENIPPGIRLVGDYATLDKKKNFAILEAETLDDINTLKAPFEKYVNIQVISVEPTEYFSNMKKQ